MRHKGLFNIAASIIALNLLIGGCGTGGGSGSKGNQNVVVNPNPVILSEDAQAKLLRDGKVIKGIEQTDCENSVVFESLNILCELFGAGSCLKQTSKCNDYARQIYTGSTLVEEGNKWNGRGGSGDLMADAVLCTLRELSPKLPNGGPLRSAVGINIGIGDVKIKQEVGYLDFDRINARFKGYRKMYVELPVLGKFDAVSQDIDLSRVEYGGHSFNPYPFAGGHQILFGYGLNLATEEKSKTLEIKPPAFEVVTPIGPFSVQPVFNYEANTGVADAFVPDYTYWILQPDNQGDVSIRLSDLYGIMPGVENNTTPIPSLSNYKELRTGWISQIGLGNRGTGDDDVWSKPNSGPFSRPDYDPSGTLDFLYYAPRSDKEKRPSVYVKASAPLKYPEDPYDLLPGWVKPLADSAGIKPTAYIQVTPTIEAGAGGQFGIALSEGTNQSRSGEFDIYNDRLAALGIYSGIRAGASFKLETMLRIKVTAGFSTPFGDITKDIIDISPKFPIPIAGSKAASNVELASAASSNEFSKLDAPETLDGMVTFKAPKVKPDPKAFIEQCYAKENEVPPEDPPKPEAEKGNPEDLFPDDIWPCNICIATDEVKDKSGTPVEPPHSDLILPAQTAPSWKCDAKIKSGCMDMCIWEKKFDETGKPILTKVKGPKEIADDIPPDDPQHNFFLSCMVSCEDTQTGIFAGPSPCIDVNPPSVVWVNTSTIAPPTPVPVDTSIAAAFSEPMDATTIDETTFLVLGVSRDGSAYLSGRVEYNPDTRTATFTPGGSLAYSATYTATITTGVRDAVGNALAEDFSWNFSTVAAPDTTPPTVISKDPADDAVRVAVNSPVRVTFSEPVNTSTVAGSFSVTIPGRTVVTVPGTFSFTDENSTVFFTPTVNLSYDTTYSVAITTGVKDPAGNALAEGVAWSFKTESR
ncbi:MAG: Ig-like domain-containing protein [Nitrospirae bacterium]|nr:Ig-like domain-containing protein [Nitrospirota bacterium]